VSTTTLALSQDMFQRLHKLSARAGQPAEAVLERALADYESKLFAEGEQPVHPRESSEAELLDDPGRIRVPPRAVRDVSARVVDAEWRAPRVRWEDD